ncbi:MAG: molybdopterin-dependent oxidoreductase [Nitrospinae bacterium]|nr:molybdopterin-dependent oxidoreductase [Nitrospinota bacterium]
MTGPGNVRTDRGLEKQKHIKILTEQSEENPDLVDQTFINSNTQNFAEVEQDIRTESWGNIESASGISQAEIKKTADIYSKSKNTVFAWSMGITHHAFGVNNVQSIINLALMRGMVGKKHAGFLPLRGHSNVQGIGSMGVTPVLKKAVFDNLEAKFPVTLPKKSGLDTLACIESANNQEIDFSFNLGGNLYGSNPDSKFAQESLSKIGFSLFLNTTLNQGHFLGRGKTSLILPVLARDEEPEPTTQESMFSYIRLSDGGINRYAGPKSEVKIIAELAHRLLKDSNLPWRELSHTGNIRELISSIIPGFEQMKNIGQTGKEFHIGGRILHTPGFPMPEGKAHFKVCPIPAVRGNKENSFILMTIRSEGQFNTVVYDSDDRYRGVSSRNVVLMNEEDTNRLGLNQGDIVTVRNNTGIMTGQKVHIYPIKPGNVMMYYPESNILVPRQFDPQSKTPSFKSIEVIVEK